MVTPKVFNLIQPDDKFKEMQYILPVGTILAKRRFTGTLAQIIASYDEKTSMVTLSHKLNYTGMQIVDFGEIPDSYKSLNIQKDKFLILQQHSEATMVHTLYHDDLFRLKPTAAERMSSGSPNIMQLYYLCNYILVTASSILSVVDIDPSHPKINKLFSFQ